MAKLKKIGVLFFAKITTIIMGVVGLVMGILYSFGGLVIDIATTGVNMGTLLAMQALIGMPAIGAGAGFAAGVIGAIVYNLAAKVFGGIENEF